MPDRHYVTRPARDSVYVIRQADGNVTAQFSDSYVYVGQKRKRCLGRPGAAEWDWFVTEVRRQIGIAIPAELRPP